MTNIDYSTKEKNVRTADNRLLSGPDDSSTCMGETDYGWFYFDVFDSDNVSDCYGKLRISVSKPVLSVEELNIEQTLKEVSSTISNQYADRGVDATYKVVRNEENLKMGYFYTPILVGSEMEIRPYTMFIYTTDCTYSVGGFFESKDYDKNELVIQRFLYLIELADVHERVENSSGRVSESKIVVGKNLEGSENNTIPLIEGVLLVRLCISDREVVSFEDSETFEKEDCDIPENKKANKFVDNTIVNQNDTFENITESKEQLLEEDEYDLNTFDEKDSLSEESSPEENVNELYHLNESMTGTPDDRTNKKWLTGDDESKKESIPEVTVVNTNKKSLDIKKTSKQIESLSKKWANEVKRTNKEILGKEPIKRSNDARKKKTVKNTESIIENYANQIESIMEMLDSVASEMEQNDLNLPDVILLLAKCFESLHMQYEIAYSPSDVEIVKYSVPKKYQSISAKWKRKYNTLPQVRIQELEESLSEIKKQISTVKGRITRNNKKLEGYVSWFDSEGKGLESEIGNCDKLVETYKRSIEGKKSLINEKESLIDKIDKEVTEIQNEYSDTIKKNKDLEKQWNEKNKELQKYSNASLKEQSRLNNQLSVFQDERRNIGVQLSQLRQDEINKRQEAEKSFLFKNRKKQEADNIHFMVQAKTDELNRIDSDINNTIQSLQQLNNKSNQDKESLEGILNEIKAEIQKNYNNAEQKKKVIDHKHDELNVLRREILVIKEEEEEIDNNVFLSEERKRVLNWSIEEKTKGKDMLTDEIQKDKDVLEDLEKRASQIKDEIESLR